MNVIIDRAIAVPSALVNLYSDCAGETYLNVDSSTVSELDLNDLALQQIEEDNGHTFTVVSFKSIAEVINLGPSPRLMLRFARIANDVPDQLGLLIISIKGIRAFCTCE